MISSVELYRRGDMKAADVGYDLRDPYDRAIWTALQLYLDFLERRALDVSRVEPDADGLSRSGTGVVDAEFWRRTSAHDAGERLRELRFRLPWELEMYLQDLRSVVRDGGRMDAVELHDTVQGVLESLLGPVRIAFGMPAAADEEPGAYNIPQEFWELGEQEIPDVGEESTLFLSGVLHPLAVLVRQGYEIATGGSVSQSEAARRLGISAEAVRTRIERGTLRAIKVGRSVFVPADAVENSIR